ncbi:MAG: AMP-binding protein [Streptomycetaceae bacterium]|nr:AMP-binding protein [Streptomycetaceae bacterium]
MTISPTTTTLTAALRARAETTPDRVAFRFITDAARARPEDALRIDYAGLYGRALAIAAALAETAPAGARVMLLYPPGIEYVAAFFGCLYAGMVAVPAYPPAGVGRPDRLLSIAADAQAAVYLTISEMADACRRWLTQTDGQSGIVGISTDQLPAAAEEKSPAASGDAGQVAFLQYTSGSTGDPKGVMLTHANLLANTRALAHRLEVGPDDRQVSWLPPYHDMGLIAGILQPVCSGHETVLMAPLTFLRDPLCWLEAIDRFGGTYCGAPNFAFDLCVRHAASPGRLAELDLRGLRTVFTGAEPIRPASLARFADWFSANGFRSSAFTPGYGLAESSLVVTMRQPGAGAGRAVQVPSAASLQETDEDTGLSAASVARGCVVPVGEPVEDCVVRIADPATRRPCPDGIVGEVWTSNPSVALGYWGKPETSVEVFQARLEGDETGRRYLRTGDLGFLIDGELHIAGRLKDVIIVRGENHYPQDLEETVWRSDPRLRQGCAAAFTVPATELDSTRPGGEADGEAGEDERVVVVQEVARPIFDADADAITRTVRKQVSTVHGIPLDELVLIRRGALPKTSSGKIRRRAARQAFVDGTLPQVGGAGTADQRHTSAAERPAAVPDAAASVRDRVLHALRTALRLPALAADDDFFEWGGDSLRAVEAAAIAAEHGVGFDVHLLYRHASAAALAREIGPGGPGGSSAANSEELRRMLREAITPVADADDYPLSPIQRRWAADYLGDQSKTWGNMSFDVPLDDPVDADRLAEAVTQVWQRHESLRTVFPERGGELRQRILAHAPVPVAVHELRGLSGLDPARKLETVRTGLAATSFDLATGPLTRLAIVHTTDGDLVLGVMHHMIADGWSVLIVRRELTETYRALENDTAAKLHPAVRYRDYAAWHSDLENSGILETARAYWQTKLTPPLPRTLPVDDELLRAAGTRGASVSATVPGPLAAATVRLAAASRISTAVLLYAAFFVVLHRRTGAQDLIIGTPLAGRDREDIRDAIGMYINQTPMRIRFDGCPDFRAVARELQQQLVESVVHQRWQLDRMAQDAGIAPEPDRFPVTSVFFSKMDFDDPLPAGAKAAPVVRLLPTDVRFHVMFYAYEHPDGLRLECRYRHGLFPEEEMRGMVEDYLLVLEELSALGLDVPTTAVVHP